MCQSEETARKDPMQCESCAEAVPGVNTSRGVFPAVGKALWFLFKWYGFVILFFILLVTLTGCEFVYLPRCQYDCTAAGGSDAYGRPAQ